MIINSVYWKRFGFNSYNFPILSTPTVHSNIKNERKQKEGKKKEKQANEEKVGGKKNSNDMRKSCQMKQQQSLQSEKSKITHRLQRNKWRPTHTYASPPSTHTGTHTHKQSGNGRSCTCLMAGLQLQLQFRGRIASSHCTVENSTLRYVKTI